jgi:hypothetical protein
MEGERPSALACQCSGDEHQHISSMPDTPWLYDAPCVLIQVSCRHRRKGYIWGGLLAIFARNNKRVITAYWLVCDKNVLSLII